MKVLITGGAGFIGHHLVEHLLKNTDWEIVVWDRLNYASSGFDRLRDIKVFDDKRVQIFTLDISEPPSVGIIKETGNIDIIFHLAAETHVDRSIENPEPFVKANVLGTMRLLDYAKTCGNLKRFFYFSTDEVFGPAPQGIAYKEWDRYSSGNPYAATKAGAEELCLAYTNTYKLPIIITHTMNAFGERQHSEKFIPKVIKSVLDETIIPIHANQEKTKAGSRFWIHARNIAAALLFLLPKSQIGEKYNIVGERELDNLEMAQTIAGIIGKPLRYELTDFHSSRPGHDLRYALNGTKMAEMGWEIPMNFEKSLEKTVRWTLENPKWL